MEAVLLLAVAASSAALARSLTGRGDAAPLAAERAARSALRRASELLRALGASRAASALLALPGWRECARWAASRTGAAGAGLDEGEAASALVLAAVGAGILASALFGSWLMLPVCVAGLLAGVPLAASRRRPEALRREAAKAMPAVFRTLAVAIGAGMTLVQAAEYAGAHVGGAVGEAFARLGLRLRCGMSTEEALAALSRELEAPGAGLLSTALVISHRTGSPLRGLFQRSAVLVERQGEFERLLAVKTAQVRMSVRVVCLLPAVMVCLLAAISPDFQEGLCTPAGTGCVLVAAALDATAVAIIRRLVGKVL